MPPNFKPSAESRSSSEQAAATLRYLRKAAEALEKHADAEGNLPPWVINKIQESAQNLGMAVSYLRYAEKNTPATSKKNRRKK